MTWAKWIFAYLFGCVHLKTTWPQRGHHGFDYVCCLDCGRELPYSTRLMCIVSDEELTKERGQSIWTEAGDIRSSRVPQSNVMVPVNTFPR
jgi:hypothetical protein